MILEPPEPVNAILNTTAVFHCTGTGRLINWVVNGDEKDTPEALAREIDVTSPRDLEHGTINSTLTIPATMDNDNITIACSAVGGNGFVDSPEVLLRVQGMCVCVCVRACMCACVCVLGIGGEYLSALLMRQIETVPIALYSPLLLT